MTGGPSETEPEPQRYTGYLIRRAQQLHVQVWQHTVSADISSVQYAILTALDHGGPLSQRELGDTVDLDRSTIADLVSRMERHDLLVRGPDPQDGRRKIVGLSAHGAAERARLQPLVQSVEDKLTGSLSDSSRAGLRRALQQMLSPRR